MFTKIQIIKIRCVESAKWNIFEAYGPEDPKLPEGYEWIEDWDVISVKAIPIHFELGDVNLVDMEVTWKRRFKEIPNEIIL